MHFVQVSYYDEHVLVIYLSYLEHSLKLAYLIHIAKCIKSTSYLHRNFDDLFRENYIGLVCSI